jgi:hypothetical protein
MIKEADTDGDGQIDYNGAPCFVARRSTNSSIGFFAEFVKVTVPWLKTMCGILTAYTDALGIDRFISGVC